MEDLADLTFGGRMMEIESDTPLAFIKGDSFLFNK